MRQKKEPKKKIGSTEFVLPLENNYLLLLLLQNVCITCRSNTIENTSVINWNILTCNQFNSFLSYQSTHQSCHICHFLIRESNTILFIYLVFSIIKFCKNICIKWCNFNHMIFFFSFFFCCIIIKDNLQVFNTFFVVIRF